MPRIDFAVACQGCASQLSGMDPAETCPTCGRAIAETVDERILDLSTGTVAVDLTCAKCSYNLRTLRFDAACPECGTPVSKSLGVEELRFCDPLWLGKVRRGINIVLISVLASIVIGILGGVTVAVLAGFRGGSPTRFGYLFMLPWIIGYILVIIGVFYITSSKPDEPSGERTNQVGRLTRFVFLIALVLTGVSMIIADPFAGFTGGSISRWSFFLGIVQSLLYGTATIGALIVLARIAVLGRRRGLHKLGRVLAWLVGFQTLGQIAVSGYTFFVWPTIAAGLPAPPFASTTTSTTVGGRPGFTTVTVISDTPGVHMPGTSSDVPYDETLGACCDHDPFGGCTESTNAQCRCNKCVWHKLMTCGQIECIHNPIPITIVPAGLNSATAPPAALVPGAGATPATPVPPMVPFAAIAMFGCFSGVVTLGAFVLGLTVLVKYRNLLTSAITASVTRARFQPPRQNGPAA